MNVLVDTHAFLWWLLDDKRLSRPARRILANPANRRCVSMAALWEIAIKTSAGHDFTAGFTLRTIVDALAAQEFAFLPIRVGDLLRLEKLDWIHRDPFDRMMIAQALEEGVALLTADATIKRYPVQTVW
jgi:PIN domain nuclease of toxin-antitoxin system